MGRLNGKVAIITGGARGMGASHARRFVAEGAKVVFTDILVKEGEELSKELGSNARFIKHDVTSQSDWEAVLAETEATFGPVNILVNNAGVAIIQPIEKMTLETYTEEININQVSVFLGMKTVLPSMRKAKVGSIVNISSTGGMIGFPWSVAYSASKFAVRGMSMVAAIEFAPDNIRVNSVHPGAIRTPMLSQDDNKEITAAAAAACPLKRVAEPEEVSNLVLFLASDEASYSTGSEFIIDGGTLCQG